MNTMTPKTKLHEAGIKAVKLLHAAGFEAYWVGGAVRDLLLGYETTNLDIATNANPNEIEKVFKSHKTKLVGKQFGTILVVMNKYPVEITTYRREAEYVDKRHPNKVVFVGDYKLDAQRRDFTVNSLYFNPVTQELLDPNNGLNDIEKKCIRFIGNPKKRIEEDYLRLIRAARLAHALNFKLDKNTNAAVKSYAKHITEVAAERVKQELDKIMISKNAQQGLALLEKVEMLKYIIPETEQAKKIFHKSKTYHLEGHVLTHTLLVVSELKIESLALRYAALFHDLGKVYTAKKVFKNNQWVNSFPGHAAKSLEIYDKFASKYKPPKDEQKLVRWLITEHDNKVGFKDSKPVKQALYALNEHFELLLDLWQADSAGNIKTDGNKVFAGKVSEAVLLGKKYIRVIEQKKTLLEKLARGEIIMKQLKINSGKKVGEIINSVRAKIILGEIKNIFDLKVFLKSKNT